MTNVDVLLIEDDEVIGRGLERTLVDAGYQVGWSRTGRGGLTAAAAGAPTLIVLDLGLPDLDGIEVCRRLRRRDRTVKILILTARRSEMDTVLGLDAGADDYVTKPFSLAELLARVRSQLRVERQSTSDAVEAAGIRVDLKSHRAHDGDRALQLRPKEFGLLALLVARAGRVVTREQIMREVWETDWMGSSKTVDMHISSLRAHLHETPDGPGRITTVRGVGYRFEP